MPPLPEFKLVNIKDIVILRSSRQRKNIDTTGLEQSIAQHGLINPITVTKDMVLKAGERRLTACTNLGWEQIPVHFLEDMDAKSAEILELEENLHRENLTWQETGDAVARIHNLHTADDPTWTMKRTAEICSLSISTVSKYLKVFQEVEKVKAEEKGETAEVIERKILSSGSLNEAQEVVQKRRDKAAKGILEVLLEEEGWKRKNVPSEESIINTDFCSWVEGFNGKKFNFLHCDFPSKDEEEFTRIFKVFCENLHKLMSVDGYLMFWCKDKFRDMVKYKLGLPTIGLQFSTCPLIWVRSDGIGTEGNHEIEMKHTYSSCLFATRGNAKLLDRRSDAYSAPTDRRIHPAAKPEPMLRYFMGAFVNGRTRMLDPTCGSGSALRAAESLGAEYVLGVEKDPDYSTKATDALKQARVLQRRGK